MVIECSGVGLKCFVTKNTLYNLPEKNSEIFLFTHLAVREDSMDLYGFSSAEELDAFKLITSVNGVGAKIGIAILSEFTPSNLYLAIASNDAKTITRAAGVGIKLAQRIVLELKDKIKNDKYIAYFQSFTNTYGDINYLEKCFMTAINRDDIVALSIGTRPDCLGEDVLYLLEKLNKIKPVWIELGLQTSNEKSAEYIRRCYPNSTYEKAVKEL